MKLALLTLSFALFQVAVGSASPSDSPGRLKQSLLKTVLKIETFAAGAKAPTSVGTGFLVSREYTLGESKGRITFLVTNKHMLGDWNIVDANFTSYNEALQVYFYRTVESAGEAFTPTKISLLDGNGNLRHDKVYLHQDPHVDVAVVLLSTELQEDAKVDLHSYDYSFLLNFEGFTKADTGLGDQVFALGYPLGITSVNNNYPIAKGGYIASVPGDEITLEQMANNRAGVPTKVSIMGKLLLIDGLLVPGNSGGPVVLVAETKVRVNPDSKVFEYTEEPSKNLVIGIVSSALGPSGLTLVYSSTYIKEAIDSFVTSIQQARHK
jgi:hypothetical protein